MQNEGFLKDFLLPALKKRQTEASDLVIILSYRLQLTCLVLSQADKAFQVLSAFVCQNESFQGRS